MVKKIADIKSIDDLGLGLEMTTQLMEAAPVNIVIAARSGCLSKFDRIGLIRTERIIKALTASGYIHVESSRSLAFRQLLAAVGIIANFGSTEEYETREEFTNEQMSDILYIVNSLRPKEAKILTMRFELTGRPKMSLADCGYLFNPVISHERVRQIENSALRRLNTAARKRRLEEIYHKIPVQTGITCDIARDDGIDEILIRELDFPTTLANALKRSDIECIGQIRNMTPKELLDLSGIGETFVGKIEDRLSELGVALPSDDDKLYERLFRR